MNQKNHGQNKICCDCEQNLPSNCFQTGCRFCRQCAYQRYKSYSGRSKEAIKRARKKYEEKKRKHNKCRRCSIPLRYTCLTTCKICYIKMWIVQQHSYMKSYYNYNQPIRINPIDVLQLAGAQQFPNVRLHYKIPPSRVIMSDIRIQDIYWGTDSPKRNLVNFDASRRAENFKGKRKAEVA